jgi:outer membrane protein TolC
MSQIKSNFVKVTSVKSISLLILSAWLSAWFSAGVPSAFAANEATSAENALGLSQAMNEARDQNPELKRAQAAQKEASWAPIEAISVNMPHFGITASHLFNAKFQVLNFNGGQVPLISPYSLASLDASWTVFDGLRGINSFRASKKAESAAELELSRAAFTLDETVRLRFYQALGAQILADVAQQNVRTLQDHLQKTREILNRGSATKFDLLRVQVQLEEAVSEKSAADDNVVLARKNLALAMGMADDIRPLTGSLPIPDEATLPGDLKADFSARTDIQALRKRADAAETLHQASYGAWIPSVTFTAEKQYYNNIDKDITSPYRDAYAVGVQLSWNVFDGGATLARNFESHYRAQQAEAAAESATLRAPQEFETYKRRYIYNASLYRARRRALEMAEESVRLATLGYNAGTRTSTDVLDAELDLIRARAGIVRAQVDGSESLINLELAVGKGLSK